MSIPELKAIPMRVITKLKEIKDLPAKFLDQLIQRPSLLNELPLQIKQQVGGVMSFYDYVAVVVFGQICFYILCVLLLLAEEVNDPPHLIPIIAVYRDG